MRLFFFFFFCVLIGVQALTDEQKEKMEMYSKECKKHTFITQELIDRGRNGDFVDDTRLKKQILCIMKKVGMATEDGEPVEEDIRRKLKKVEPNEEEIDKIVAKCVVKKDTAEDTALNVAKCLHENKPVFSPID